MLNVVTAAVPTGMASFFYSVYARTRLQKRQQSDFIASSESELDDSLATCAESTWRDSGLAAAAAAASSECRRDSGHLEPRIWHRPSDVTAGRDVTGSGACGGEEREGEERRGDAPGVTPAHRRLQDDTAGGSRLFSGVEEAAEIPAAV